MPSHKKLFLILSIGIIGGGLLLARQIKATRSITVKTVSAPLVSPLAVDLPITSTDPLLGNPGAPLTATIFGDLSDVGTRTLLGTVTNFVNRHPADIRLYFKPTPQEHILENALMAHEALWCALPGRQFWPLLQEIIKLPSLNENTLTAIAQKLKLDAGSLINCAKLPATKETVLNATAAAKNIGIISSPTLFLNNKQINLEEGVDVEQMLTTFIKP